MQLPAEFQSLILSTGYLFLAVLPFAWLSLLLQGPVGKFHRDRLDLFSPLFIVAGAVLIGTTLRTGFVLLDAPDAIRISRLFGDQEPEGVLLPGLVAINLAIASWTMGYLSLPYKRLRQASTPRSLSTRRYFAVLAAASIFAALLIALYLDRVGFFDHLTSAGLSAKRFTYIGNEVTTFGHLRLGAFVLATVTVIQAVRYYVIDRSRFNGALLACLVLASMVFPFISSTRGEIIYLLISIVVVRHYGYRRIRVSAIIAMALVSFLVLGLMETLRQQSYGEDVDFRPDQVINTMIYTPHFVDVGKTSVILEKVPKDFDFLYGKSYAMTLIAPIPRVLWEDKPVVRIGRHVGQDIYERPNCSGVPPGMIGEAYLNFGWPGIGAVLFIAGLLSKVAYGMLIVRRPARDVFRLGLYAIISVTILDFLVVDFTGSVMRLSMMLIPYLVFMGFALERDGSAKE